MNRTTTLARALATIGTLAVLTAGCGATDPDAPARRDEPGTPPAAGSALDLSTPPPPARPPCRFTADQVERYQAWGTRPTCVRDRQREARRDYRRLTRVHHVGHQ